MDRYVYFPTIIVAGTCMGFVMLLRAGGLIYAGQWWGWESAPFATFYGVFLHWVTWSFIVRLRRGYT